MRRTAWRGAAATAVLVLSGCALSGQSAEPGPSGTTSTEGTTDQGDGQSTAPTDPSNSPQPVKRPVTIAFAGDVHFASFLASRLDHPRTALGPMADLLARADLSIVNLETAVTTRGTPQPKEFVFRAPPVVFTALKDAGVDVATMANNHGLDYGPVSVPDALDAARAAKMPVIGIGENAAQAFRPWIVTVKGQRIAFLAATAVLDASLVSSWSAGPDHPGVAAAIDGNNAGIVDAVKAVRPHVDTVVVDLHYGSDLQTCPTEIQRALAADLAEAGADVVIGQHAHVVLGGGYEGTTYVDYGLGNFQFYTSSGGPQAETGVLELTVDGRSVTSPRWVPGTIVGGMPTRLTGDAAASALDRWNGLRDCAGLTAEPERAP